MVVVTTTGYFVSILGPYLADRSNNDASILSHIINSNAESIRSWLSEDDVFIVDRGLRDALPLLADLGIQAEMPTFLKAGQKQMSTEDANMSRLVTKVCISNNGVFFLSAINTFVKYYTTDKLFTSGTQSLKKHTGTNLAKSMLI